MQQHTNSVPPSKFVYNITDPLQRTFGKTSHILQPVSINVFISRIVKDRDKLWVGSTRREERQKESKERSRDKRQRRKTPTLTNKRLNK